jgi:hydroxypyruvate isomerase
MMPRFSANLSQLYTNLQFLDRFDAAAADGFTGVEYRGPYEFSASLVGERLRANGLTQVLFNLPAGNWDKGERGIACLPGRENEFRQGLEKAILYADVLGCSQLNCLAGLMPSEMPYDVLENTLVANLKYACGRLAGTGITLLIEPLNRRDLPSCMLSGSASAERVLAMVDATGLRLQYDFYHMQITQGDVLYNFARLQPLIGHVQVAGNPGRHEPNIGELNFDYIFAELDRLRYGGWVGCEYLPLADTSEGLGWLRKWL